LFPWFEKWNILKCWVGGKYGKILFNQCFSSQ
jgi:hypothetical protein